MVCEVRLDILWIVRSLIRCGRTMLPKVPEVDLSICFKVAFLIILIVLAAL